MLGCASLATGLLACVPPLPEQILLARQAVLRTPVGDFVREIAALEGLKDAAPALPPGVEHVAHPSQARDWSYDAEEERPASQLQVEMTEFTEWLNRRRVPENQRSALLEAYKTYRATVETHDPSSHHGAEDASQAATGYSNHPVAEITATSPTVAPPLTVPAPLAAVLPPEWVDYLQGADCFHAGHLSDARQCWERLLARPQVERLERSVWAAFMLARMLETEGSPAESAARYRRVRELRAAGCADRLNLVAASLGWEARLAFNGKDFSQAARLYYLQARGGTLDGDSLRTVAEAALGKGKDDPVTMASARDPFLRRVVTLSLACSRRFGDWTEGSAAEPEPASASTSEASGPGDDPSPERSGRDWLEALKSAGVDHVHEAAQVAWAAYQQGAYSPAADWLKLAPADDPLALWLRAKLALRAGSTDEAAADFARVMPAFSAEPSLRNEVDPTDGLVNDVRGFRSRQFRMDQGIVQLSRGDFKQAFDCLLRSGFWCDAAYVAEQVLTVEELSQYVQAHYPTAPAIQYPPAEEADAAASGDEEDRVRRALQSGTDSASATDQTASALRYLLARRLARTGHYAEARRYYPAVLLPRFDEYVAARKTGETGTAPKPKRAAAYWRAAKIERHLGMELFGTEAGPDWHVEEGEFDLDDYRVTRLGLATAASPEPAPGEGPMPNPAYVPPVGAQEKRRLAKEEPQPFERYHYRYLAAELAWKAALLMPDQQEDTAQVLAAGGGWLESVDATKAADRFYLAILRRCNRTTLGKEANESGELPASSDDKF